MMGTPEPDEGGHGGVQVFRIERYHLGVQTAQMREKHWTRIVTHRAVNTIAVSTRVGTPDHHFGSVDSIDQPFVAGFPEVNGNDGGTIQNHGSVAFRPIPQDAVFFLAIHYAAQLGGRHRYSVPGSKIPFVYHSTGCSYATGFGSSRPLFHSNVPLN